jgi:hypothetical protein
MYEREIKKLEFRKRERKKEEKRISHNKTTPNLEPRQINHLGPFKSAPASPGQDFPSISNALKHKQTQSSWTTRNPQVGIPFHPSPSLYPNHTYPDK